MDWVSRLNQAMDEVEARLMDSVDAGKLARITCCSVSQFQRIFTFIVGVPLAEHVRRRRMTRAAVDLQRGATVLDTALKFGYDSPTAFNRAFQQVHGVPPSSAKREGVRLKAYPPIRFHISIKGEVEMDFRIESREAFTVVGMERAFTMDGGAALAEIPKFWDEFFANGYGDAISPELGVCIEDAIDSPVFRYLIAERSAPGKAVPEGFMVESIPAMTWAIFEGKGPMPHALQDLNRRIYEEWLPTNGRYELGAGYCIEYYSCGDTSSDDYVFEIWLPVKAKA